MPMVAFLKNDPRVAAKVARKWFGCGSDVVRMWFGCGSDAVRMWFGCGSDVVRVRFGCGSVWFSEFRGGKCLLDSAQRAFLRNLGRFVARWGRRISALRGKRRWRCFSRPIGQAQAPQGNWALSSDPTLRRPALSVSAGAESLRSSAVFIMAVQTT